MKVVVHDVLLVEPLVEPVLERAARAAAALSAGMMPRLMNSSTRSDNDSACAVAAETANAPPKIIAAAKATVTKNLYVVNVLLIVSV